MNSMPVNLEMATVRATFIGLLLGLAGCDGGTPVNPPGGEPVAQSDGQSEAMAEGTRQFDEIKGTFAQIIEEESARYHPLVYRFDEDLLAKMDGVESKLSRKSPPSDADATKVRLIPEVDADQEEDHFRESIRRWSAKTKRDFREAIDRLKADLAAVDKTKAFHPEFHKKFSAVFDEFIPIEVLEMRERRNRAIHRRVRELLDPHRNERPRTVAYFEKQIAGPPYQDPDSIH